MTTKRILPAALAALLLAVPGAGLAACGGADGGGEEVEVPAGEGDNSGAAAGTEGGDE